MHYSNFPDRINVKKTSEQCFKPLLLPENRKTVGKETETQVRGWKVDKWTVGLNKGGLYNRVKPSEEGDRKILKKNIEEDTL